MPSKVSPGPPKLHSVWTIVNLQQMHVGGWVYAKTGHAYADRHSVRARLEAQTFMTAHCTPHFPFQMSSHDLSGDAVAIYETIRKRDPDQPEFLQVRKSTAP